MVTKIVYPCEGCCGSEYEDADCQTGCSEYKEYLKTQDMWNRYFDINTDEEVD